MVPIHDYEKRYAEPFTITKIRTFKHEPFFCWGWVYIWYLTVHTHMHITICVSAFKTTGVSSCLLLCSKQVCCCRGTMLLVTLTTRRGRCPYRACSKTGMSVRAVLTFNFAHSITGEGLGQELRGRGLIRHWRRGLIKHWRGRGLIRHEGEGLY